MDPGFVGPEVYIIFEELFMEKHTKLHTKVNIYLEREKKSQHITNFKKATNTTYITKPRKKTYFY